MAVYTRVSFEEAEKFLEEYNLGLLKKITEISEGVENSNFFIDATSGRYVLTLFEKRVNENEIPFFMDLTEHMEKKGIHCPAPIRNKNGKAISELNDRKAVIISFLPGKSILEPDKNNCFELGAKQAKMHLAVQDFKQTRKNGLDLEGWKIMRNRIAAVASANQEVLALIDGEISYQQQNWPSGLPEGVIHADLFPNNVFYEDGKITGVIDFYFACTGYFAYDIAISINSWCFNTDFSYSKAKTKGLISGYETIRNLQDNEKQALQTLARAASLRFLLTRYFDLITHNSENLVTPLNPDEYIQKLKFNQTLKIYNDLF